jgi:hypothetical protein
VRHNDFNIYGASPKTKADPSVKPSAGLYFLER